MQTKTKNKIRIGAGAGYSGDRIEPAVELAEKGNIHYLVFECLAERTIALAQQRKEKDPALGFDPLLVERMEACLPACKKNQIKIITNMGAANPLAAMEKTADIARKLGLKDLKIAAVTGDDVLHLIKRNEYETASNEAFVKAIMKRIISANAYLGAGPIVEALNGGADIVITGRVADPSLFIAPLVHEFNWPFDDYRLLGQGTVLGHLLECAGQITGGYFADPGFKDVPALSRLGFPIAEVSPGGQFVISKVPEAGGMVTIATCKEQLLYEIHDPAGYYTPDVIADFSGVRFTQVGKDEVLVEGATGKAKTGLLKVSVGYKDGYIGEGQISYGGPGAVERGRLALEIVKQRFMDTGLPCNESRFELIGLNTLFGPAISGGEPFEVRARVAARTSTLADAVKVGNEVETLYTNGPAGGGGVAKVAREVIAMTDALVDAGKVHPVIHYQSV